MVCGLARLLLSFPLLNNLALLLYPDVLHELVLGTQPAPCGTDFPGLRFWCPVAKVLPVAPEA